MTRMLDALSYLLLGFSVIVGFFFTLAVIEAALLKIFPNRWRG